MAIFRRPSSPPKMALGASPFADRAPGICPSSNRLVSTQLQSSGLAPASSKAGGQASDLASAKVIGLNISVEVGSASVTDVDCSVVEQAVTKRHPLKQNIAGNSLITASL